MDMVEHQLLHFSPQEHFMASPGFFAAVDGGHFQTGGFVVEPPVGVVAGIEDGGWVEDLMQLGDELFGGGDVIAAGTGDHHQPWQFDDNGGSPDDPPPSVSVDGRDGSPRSAEQGAGDGELASEPHRDRENGDDGEARSQLLGQGKGLETHVRLREAARNELQRTRGPSRGGEEKGRVDRGEPGRPPGAIVPAASNMAAEPIKFGSSDGR